jgi:molybdenum cofactor guanylyltransferase
MRTRFAGILAGGASTRFGSNKALLEVDGQPQVQRMVSWFQKLNLQTVIATNSLEPYTQLGLEVAFDQQQYEGPLRGLQTVLHFVKDKVAPSRIADSTFQAVRDEAVRDDVDCLIVSCDLLNWNDDWIDLLEESMASKGEAAAAAIRFDANDGRYHPFPGVYRLSLIPVVDQLLSKGERSLQSLFRTLGSDRVAAVPMETFGEVWNANTPDEFQAWREFDRQNRL